MRRPASIDADDGISPQSIHGSPYDLAGCHDGCHRVLGIAPDLAELPRCDDHVIVHAAGPSRGSSGDLRPPGPGIDRRLGYCQDPTAVVVCRDSHRIEVLRYSRDRTLQSPVSHDIGSRMCQVVLGNFALSEPGCTRFGIRHAHSDIPTVTTEAVTKRMRETRSAACSPTHHISLGRRGVLERPKPSPGRT